MEKNLEIEFKMLLNESEFLNLKQTVFHHVDCITQINEYFDTDDGFLGTQHFMARIRTFDDGSNEFTLKVPQTHHKTMEYTISSVIGIDDVRITQLLSQFDCPLTLKSIASSKTLRCEFENEIGKLALDTNYFMNDMDYEIEFEVTNPQLDYEQFWAHFCFNHRLDYIQAKPKVYRAFKSANIKVD